MTATDQACAVAESVAWLSYSGSARVVLAIVLLAAAAGVAYAA